MEKPSHAPRCFGASCFGALCLIVTKKTSSTFVFLLLLSLSCSLSHTLTLLSDSSHKPQALLVLTTHLDLFSILIIHRSQLANLQTPPFYKWGKRCSHYLPPPSNCGVCSAPSENVRSCVYVEGGGNREKQKVGGTVNLIKVSSAVKSSHNLLPI